MKIFKHKNLVYLTIFKHASGSYATFFEGLGWDIISREDIDWQNHKVFAHILNPVTKHIKAQAQAIYLYDLHKLFDDPNLEKIIAYGILDYHAVTLTNSIGSDCCNIIDWIPLDLVPDKLPYQHRDLYVETMADELTRKFLVHNSVDVDNCKFPHINVCEPEKEIIVEKVSNIVKKYSQNEAYNVFYHRDIILYNNVMKSFKHVQGIPKNQIGNWDTISWLRHR
jgi:hypothetical protein